MGILSNHQKEALKTVVNTFKANNIPFQISGGLAAILYGVKRPLYDIDVEVYKKDMPQTITLFQKDISEAFHHIQDAHFDLWLLTLKINGVSVDISQADECYVGDGQGEKIRVDSDLSKAHWINFEGLEVPVVSPSELIAYKTILARDTDLIDMKQMNLR